MNSKISPRIVAEVAIEGIRNDVKSGFIHGYTDICVGKLCACHSITQDWEIEGWKNEAWYLTGDYASRHNLRWRT